MELFVTWCSFIGAWLLVAGSIYQAALELKDQDIERDRLAAAAASVTRQRSVSAWWWLLPPVKLLLERRRSNQYRRDYLAAMTREDIEAFVAFMNKAYAWFIVASGGLLIAVKESYELTHLSHINNVVLGIVIFVLLISAVLHTAVRIAHSDDLLKSKG